MAWTDQCKIEAVKQVEHRMENGMTKLEALRETSKESDIPVGTLNRWKYGKQNSGFTNEPKKRMTDYERAIKLVNQLAEIIIRIRPIDLADKRSLHLFNSVGDLKTLFVYETRQGRSKRQKVDEWLKTAFPVELKNE